MSISILDRELFSEAEAARLLGVAQSTVHYWLEGAKRGRKTYPPVVRAEPNNNRSVTWAEFVEAGLLREYRREMHVPMPELRDFIDRLRDGFGIPYPLAHARPFVGDKQLVWDAQKASGLDPDFCLVAEVQGQLILTGPSDSFFSRVTWADDIATKWRPANDPNSPVRIDPEMRFGRPSIRGISTETLWEHVDAGEDAYETATDFDLDIRDVRWALAYESARRAA